MGLSHKHNILVTSGMDLQRDIHLTGGFDRQGHTCALLNLKVRDFLIVSYDANAVRNISIFLKKQKFGD